jgi:hypothetical protein
MPFIFPLVAFAVAAFRNEAAGMGSVELVA